MPFLPVQPLLDMCPQLIQDIVDRLWINLYQVFFDLPHCNQEKMKRTINDGSVIHMVGEKLSALSPMLGLDE
jgi:hypothetical protein